jgi:hypothetical protein
MPGQFFTGATETGGIAFTAGSNRVGFLGINEARGGPRGGGANGAGVFGLTFSQGAAGVFGANNSRGRVGVGVQGNGPDAGVSGFSPEGVGVRGFSDQTVGVLGIGIEAGVSGFSRQGVGVRGFTAEPSDHGIFGMNGAGGQVPEGLDRPAGGGVWGHTRVERGSGVIGSVEPGLELAAGLTGIGPIAGRFFGDVEVTGDIRLLNADCAEEFDLSTGLSAVEPGTVMVLVAEGALQPSQHAYDKKVAGVVSGAGRYKPAIVLDRQPSHLNRLPIALLGKVYCKADATHMPIEVGDLLTTSSTPGHAMKADDPSKAFGAVIGKALRHLPTGQGLIPILIALQ